MVDKKTGTGLLAGGALMTVIVGGGAWLSFDEKVRDWFSQNAAPIEEDIRDVAEDLDEHELEATANHQARDNRIQGIVSGLNQIRSDMTLFRSETFERIQSEADHSASRRAERSSEISSRFDRLAENEQKVLADAARRDESLRWIIERLQQLEDRLLALERRGQSGGD